MSTRRRAVLAELDSLIDRLNRTQESVGLPAIDTVAGGSDPARMEHIAGLVMQVRGGVVIGEPSQTVMLAAAAQLVAWATALDEAAETRVDNGDDERLAA